MHGENHEKTISKCKAYAKYSLKGNTIIFVILFDALVNKIFFFGGGGWSVGKRFKYYKYSFIFLKLISCDNPEIVVPPLTVFFS